MRLVARAPARIRISAAKRALGHPDAFRLVYRITSGNIARAVNAGVLVGVGVFVGVSVGVSVGVAVGVLDGVAVGVAVGVGVLHPGGLSLRSQSPTGNVPPDRHVVPVVLHELLPIAPAAK